MSERTILSRLTRALLVCVKLGLFLLILLGTFEGGVALFGPTPLSPPELRYPDGRTAPASEVMGHVREMRLRWEGRSQEAPAGMLQPGLVFDYWYDPRGGLVGTDGTARVTVSDRGLRGANFSAMPADGTIRILVVGDSFTFGNGVSDAECWTVRAEEAFRRVHGLPVEILNGGFAAGGHDPIGYADWILEHGLRFRPHILVIGICLNDLGPVPMVWSPQTPKILIGLPGTAALYRACTSPPDPDTFFSKHCGDSEHLAAVQRSLLLVRDRCRQDGVRFALVTFPMLDRLGNDYPYVRFHELIQQFGANARVPVVDFREALVGAADRELWVHPTDQHPNGRACEMMGRFFAGQFEKAVMDCLGR